MNTDSNAIVPSTGETLPASVADVLSRYPGSACGAGVYAAPAPVRLVMGDYSLPSDYCWPVVVSDLFLFLERSGFPVLAVDNGECASSCADDLGLAIEQATACDEATITCGTPSGERGLSAFLVLGNAPCELVADYSSRQSVDGKEFDSVLSAWSDSWLEIEECPTWEQVKAGWRKAGSPSSWVVVNA